ncbi:DMT family transporter [Microbacterium sp. 179-I 3D3 NHS]|uniref:DMT family transporter n=1 Tax=Microbacterium sp. 179-I 3D3 NHS TaxID=3142382 RepID=UPI00399FC557
MTSDGSSSVSGAALPVAAVLLSVVLWSTTYGLSAIALVTASPAVLSELRLVLAVPPLLVLILLGARPRVAAVLRALRRPRTIVLALTGVALFSLPSNIGLTQTTAGTASLMSASLPVLTALIAWRLLGERMTRRVLMGLTLTTAGIVVSAVGAVDLGTGAALIVAGLASYALYTVLLRRAGSTPEIPSGPSTSATAATATDAAATDAAATDAAADADPLVVATATAVWGAVLLAPWLLFEVATGSAAWPSTGEGWAAVAFLGLVVTGPTMALFTYGAERVPAAVSGTATGAVPALGYAFAVALGEPVDAVKVVGGALALVGIVVAAVPQRTTRPPRGTRSRQMLPVNR